MVRTKSFHTMKKLSYLGWERNKISFRVIGLLRNQKRTGGTKNAKGEEKDKPWTGREKKDNMENHLQMERESQDNL